MSVKTQQFPDDDESTRLPIRGFARLYQAQLKSERKSPKTIQAYDYALIRFQRWFEGCYHRIPLLSDFTAPTVRLFLADAMDRPKWEGHPFLERETDARVSGSTIHQYVRSLKTFGQWLEREEYAALNPLRSVRLPKLEEKELVPLTEEEERLLLGSYDDNNATECRIKAIFLVMLDTGLRLSETVNLRDEAVDLEHGFLVVVNGKGGKTRSVPFGFTTERVLRKYLTFFRASPATPAIDRFFLSPDGYPLTDKALTMVFARARKRTGIQRLHAHLLRHTYGIRAQENDMPTITLQHYMGHSSSKVTERYTHAAQSERLKRARGYSPVDQLHIRVRSIARRNGGRGRGLT